MSVAVSTKLHMNLYIVQFVCTNFYFLHEYILNHGRLVIFSVAIF